MLAISGCARREIPKPQPGAMSPHQEARAMNGTAPISEVIAMQEKAIDAMRKGQISESGFEVLSQMGHFQCRAGNYAAGLRYLQEAGDSLMVMEPDSIDANAAVKFLGNLANIYVRFGLYDEALRKSDEALTIATEKNSSFLPDLWRMRGIIYEHKNIPDSQLICLRNSIATSQSVPDPFIRDVSIVLNGDAKEWFFIENPQYEPDSIRSAVSALEKSLGKYKHNNATNILLIGRGYVLLGNPSKGIPLMEKGVVLFREKEDLESLEWALGLLAQSYAETGNKKLIDIYPETSALHDTIQNRLRDNILLGKDFQYRTSELKAANKLLDTELAVTHQRYIFLVILAVIILITIVLAALYRSSQHKRLLRLKEENINNLIAERIALNAHIEKLNLRMSDSATTTESPDMFLTQVLLEKDDEMRFRKNFIELHPLFIKGLRKDYPELTSGNELLCMLIALHKTNDEISLALGISRESVATARYRLRARFKLPKETDLNDFIQSRIDSNQHPTTYT